MFKNNFNGKKIEKKHQVNKTFSYKKNTSNLGFTIDIENKMAMQEFVELLKEAMVEIEVEINKLT